MLEDRPEPPRKVKLDNRRGYGDGDIPSQIELLILNDPKRT
jgi:hypothetical protein